MISVISFILAFLSGMNIKRRVGINLLIGATAVVVTYSIGLVAKSIWGIQV
jgi:VIT1/CCC1 family predicted Fe2+/Mn2+ transporter